MQCVKGDFSYRAKRELNWNGALWQAGFSDHRIRDLRDYEQHAAYIEQNPVKASFAEAPFLYLYSSAAGVFPVSPVPQRLKPHTDGQENGGAEAPPLQTE